MTTKVVKALAEGKVEYEIRADDSKLDSDLNKAEKKIKSSAKSSEEAIKSGTKETEKNTESAGEKVGGLNPIFDKVGVSGKAAFLGIAGAAIGLGKKAVSSANELDTAMNQFAASTGTGQDSLGEYEDTLKSIYANNYGDSFEDIADSMATVKQQMGDLDQSSLRNITESAFALRDTFGYDVGESVRAASTLMDQFGIDGDKAMGLIATGAQNGLDFSGELLDSINEYSVQFGKVGLDADDMFKIMEKGAESGAFNLDKVGDAIKELSIRAIDGSDTTKAGFEALGLDADEMAAKFAAGGDSAKEAFDQTISALASMEDPLAQNTAGVNLFGTQWEDLGPEVVSQLASIEDGAYATGEAMDEMKDVKYDDIGSVFEGIKRSLDLLLVPLGEALIPLLGTLLEALQPLIGVIGESLTPIFEQIGEVLLVLSEPLGALIEFLGQILGIALQLVSQILTPILDLVMQLLEPLTQLISGILDPLMALIQSLMGPLTTLIQAALQPVLSLISALIEPLTSLMLSILPPIQSLFSALTPVLQTLFSALTPVFEIFGSIASIVGDVLSPVIEVLAGVFSGVLAGAVESVTSVLEPVTGIFQGIIDFVKNVFTGNWEGAWNAVKDIFGNVWEAIKNVFKAPINWIIDGINGFLGGINSIKIPDWVPIVGGKGFNIPLIPRLQKGEDFVMDDWQPAYLDYGERVLTRAQNVKFTALGGLEGMESALSGEMSASYASSPIVVHSVTPVYLDGKLISSNVTQHQFDAVKVRRFK
nr:phage tail tape measure protein [uncultured Solibaculum sp.]